MFLVLSYHGEVKAASKRCHIVRIYPGKCRNNGNKACLDDITKDKRIQIFKYDRCSSCMDADWPENINDRVCNCSRAC
ncbi:hypothetical protein AALP_AA1G090400 [Arabis alpina]|uniref:Uncharacterized protein n=1 Tax=Arabis alpina TaxID=50452 RepID=A0A087HM28_ARAAL|nr:hypothetical protein AALP_AA1G090400 [Arabis alpina]